MSIVLGLVLQLSISYGIPAATAPANACHYKDLL
jgi:hypothetical protein